MNPSSPRSVADIKLTKDVGKNTKAVMHVQVPRCPRCGGRHSTEKVILGIGAVIGFVVGVFAVMSFTGGKSLGGGHASRLEKKFSCWMLLLAIIVVAAPFVAVAMAINSLTRPSGIQPLSHAATHPSTRVSGWKAEDLF